MADEQKQEPKTFKGSDFVYTEIATRGSEKLALNMIFGGMMALKHGVPVARSVVAFRFVAVAKSSAYADLMKFTHFKARGDGQYEKGTIHGKKLNLVTIPLYDGLECPHLLCNKLTQDDMWPMLAGWVEEQVVKEGFTMDFLDLAEKLKKMGETFGGLDKAELVMEFPDLTQQD